MKSIFKKIIVSVLTLEAKVVLRKYKPDIIAVTGSVGKTSTKDAIYTLVSPSVFVRKSEKSFNSEIGLPLTILGCQNGWSDPIAWLANIAHGLSLIMYRAEYPKCLILEVGADHPGDIKKLGKWFHPDIAVITAVSKVPVHVEFFSSPKAVLEEKLALVMAVKPSGKLVLPATDADILAVRKEPSLAAVPCLTFGINSSGDVTATSVEIQYGGNGRKGGKGNEKDGEKAADKSGHPTGMSFKLNYAGNSIPVSITGVVGFQHVYSMVAAAAAALGYGISLHAIAEAIPHHQVPRGRMNVLEGIGGNVLIDDSYNASPDAVKEALAVLCDVNAAPSSGVSRKIAVLGDMMELGSFSLEQHKNIGRLAAHALMTLPIGVATDIGHAPDTTENATLESLASDITATMTTVDETIESVQIVETSTSVETAVLIPQKPYRNENLLVTVGIRARDIAEGALAAGMSQEVIRSFDTSAEAAHFLEKIAGESGNSVILVKGSQSSRMERVTRALLAGPDGRHADQTLAAALLVRQDPEWLAIA